MTGTAYRSLGYFLAEKLLEGLTLFPGLPADTVLVPVPPRPSKWRHMGWDQVAHLGRLLRRLRVPAAPRGYPVRPCLRRLPSASQKSLTGRARSENLMGKIRYASRHAGLPPRPANVPRHAVVFDDVITSGATLTACAAALKRAGVQSVYTLALFYS